jgi:hypothetical protein
MFQHWVPLRISRAPAYLSAANFTSILFNILKKKDKAVEQVEEVIQGLPPDSKLRKVLEQLRDEGNEKVEDFKARLQSWFDDVMSQASGWYKRHLQIVTLLVGLCIAAVFNADSFKIYRHLTTDAAAREQINLLAEKYVAENQTAPTVNVPDEVRLREMKTTIDSLVNSETFQKTTNILGLGWRKGEFYQTFEGWFYRILGWLVTALAISLGAPFWFDVLKKIITIRSSGGESQSTGAPTQVVINTGTETKVTKAKV